MCPTLWSSQLRSSSTPATLWNVNLTQDTIRRTPTHTWTRADTITTAVIGLLALFTRFIGLTKDTASGTPVFDEKHYVPQAWDVVRSWHNVFIGGIESNPGYGLVVHPPLAKQLIAWGEALFGYTPLGWRVVTASCGVGVVLVIMAITRRLTCSTQAATFAGILATFDGVLLVTSRFGMLDIIQTLFILLATWAFIRDDQRTYPGVRWWRIACGVFLGMTLAVKWSGLYYMACFGLLSVILSKERKWQWLFDAIKAFCALVILPVAVYAWSWRAWFASESSVYRHAATDGTIEADSLLHHLPDTLASWLYYHQSVLSFHASLTTSNGNDHPFDSKPWEWLVGIKPILYLSTTDISCGENTCRKMLYLFGTPAIWWLIVPAVLWALWASFLGRREYYIPVFTFIAGYLPWLIAYDRQMYFFYATALIPFVIIILAIILHGITRTSWRPVAYAYLALVVAMFIFYVPILYGLQITDQWFNVLMWLPAWR